MQEIIQDFLNSINNNVEDKIYNEFSLQHELGIFLRKKLEDKYRVDFERNKNYFGGSDEKF
ncbi:MAG: hypothetical protein R6U95_05055, partial [Bacteroidales bacterium]